MNPNDTLDDEIADVIDDALDALQTLLGTDHDTHAATELAAAAQLISYVHHRLPDLVAEARDQDMSWVEIARQLGLTRLGTMARYGHHARTRPQPITLD
jgi:hypothetical protein